MRLESFALTDIGRKRKHNEDNYLRDDRLGLYIVADGMGGHLAGEVASAEAVETIHGMIRRGWSIVEAMERDPSPGTIEAVRRLMDTAIQAATYMLFGMAEQDPSRKGMGTTISALLLAGGRGITAQVGDSRIYLIRRGVATQLTEDHTWVAMQVKEGCLTAEEAKNAPHANVLTRAVGAKDYVQVDIGEVAIEPGDHLVLCSDGLHSYLDAGEIASVIGPEPLSGGARLLINMANERGGKDNITAVLVRIAG